MVCLCQKGREGEFFLSDIGSVQFFNLLLNKDF